MNDFTWTEAPDGAYQEAVDLLPPVASRRLSAGDESDRMRIDMLLVGEAMDHATNGAPTFRVFARTQRNDARARSWTGSRPITVAELQTIDDPYGHASFRCVSCLRKGTSLVCTPWRYRHAWEGIGGTVRGEPVTIENVFTARVDERAAFGEWISFVDYPDTLARVCALVGHGTDGYVLRTTESNFGNAYVLDLDPSKALWCTS